MNRRRHPLALLMAVAASTIAAAACSSSRSGATVLTPTVPVSVTSTTAAATTTTVSPTTTTVAPTTTLAPTTTVGPTTTVPASTSTTMAPTTTTEPPGASLPLRFDGVGDARFGTEPDDVIRYISSVLGEPTADTGWVGAAGVGCAGGQARVMFWNDLRLTFGDESDVSSGRRHFFAWRYGPAFGTQINPAGMTTLTGLTIGADLDEVERLYPGSEVVADDTVSTPTVRLAPELQALLSDATDAGVVTTLLGGENCTVD